MVKRPEVAILAARCLLLQLKIGGVMGRGRRCHQGCWKGSELGLLVAAHPPNCSAREMALVQSWLAMGMAYLRGAQMTKQIQYEHASLQS